MPLIWTDEDGRVTHTHHQPENISYSKARDAIEVELIPSPETEDSPAQPYYSEEDGFWFEEN